MGILQRDLSANATRGQSGLDPTYLMFSSSLTPCEKKSHNAKDHSGSSRTVAGVAFIEQKMGRLGVNSVCVAIVEKWILIGA